MNCPKCGALLVENARFCGSCGYNLAAANETPAEEQKPENVFAGFIGALIGAALGGGVIILMSRLGYVASLSGVAIAVSVLEGYDLFGGRPPAKGLILCIALMLITPYIADRIDWAIVVSREFASDGVTFGQAFAMIPELVGNGIDSLEYTKHLLFLYGFAALGAFGTIKGLFQKK